MRQRLMCVLCFVFLLLLQKSYGQSTTDVPPFKLLQTNGKFFTAKELPKNKPVVLIYFAPDCGHCITLMNGVFKEKAAFKNATVVLATFKPVNELAVFERTYQTAANPNMWSGTEGNTFFLRHHYKLQKTPFVAVFDRKGKLTQSFRNDPNVAQVKAALQQVK